MVDRALKAGSSVPSSRGNNQDDLASEVDALGDSDAGRILNRVLTHVKKLEMRVDERLEISEFNKRLEEFRSITDQSTMDGLSTGAPSLASASTGLSDRERKKWNDACKKIGELEK